jgi:hypothetical protein
MINPPSRIQLVGIHFDGGGFDAEGIGGVLAGALACEVLVGGADPTVEGGFRGHLEVLCATSTIELKLPTFTPVWRETAVSGHVNESTILESVAAISLIHTPTDDSGVSVRWPEVLIPGEYSVLGVQ